MDFGSVAIPADPVLLAALSDLAGDAQMIILGEEMHGDGATFAAKALLARLLFEHGGFDTVAWESPIYAVRAMNDLDPSVTDDDYAARGLFAIWHGPDVEGLVGFCRERGIRSEGVDCQLLNGLCLEELSEAVSGWATATGHSMTSAEVQGFIGGGNEGLEPRLEGLLSAHTGEADPWPAVALSNILANRRQQRIGAPVYGAATDAEARAALDPYDPVLVSCNSARDEAMAVNALRLLDEGRRVVLWAANYHAIRSLHRIEPYATRAPHVRTMGDYLHDAVGSAVRVVVGTSARGTRWDFNRWEAVPVDERTDHSVESEWPTGPAPHLGLVREGDAFPGPVHLVGVGQMTLERPSRHFDAVLHVEVQRPPTYSRW